MNEFHLSTPEVRTRNQEKLTSISALIENKEDEKLFANIDGITYTSSTPYCIDFIKESVNKANGIKHMMEYWGLKEDAYIAFGDSENDIEMLMQATLGIAMENGNEKAKAKADIICGPSNEASIANMLINLKLI